MSAPIQSLLVIDQILIFLSRLGFHLVNYLSRKLQLGIFDSLAIRSILKIFRHDSISIPVFTATKPKTSGRFIAERMRYFVFSISHLILSTSAFSRLGSNERSGRDLFLVWNDCAAFVLFLCATFE